MRVIFLDIDGVVNTLILTKENLPYNGCKKYNDVYCYFADIYDKRVSNEQAIMWLNIIYQECKIDGIIITSTWRLLDDENATLISECLYNTGLNKNIKILGKTGVDKNRHRGTEIDQYLEEHPEIKEFIIIDDDSDMEPFMDRLVQTDIYAGINARSFQKAKRLFKGV